MNKPLSPAQLEQSLVAKLRELLGQVAWLQDWSVQNHPGDLVKGVDFEVKLPLPNNRKVKLWVQCKTDPRPSQFPYINVPKESVPSPVLVFAAPYISSRMAEVCREHGWSWFDLSGNHWLDIPGLMRLHRTGKSPVHKSPRPTANLSTPEAGRVVRALLLPDNAGMRWTQWEMQKHCQPNVSIGLVNKIARYLREEAFTEEMPAGGFRLRDPLKLLFAWREAYRFERQERRSYFTLLQGKKLRDALAGLGLQSGGFALYASFSAAEFQSPHVRQPKNWLYVRQQDLAKLEEMVEAKPVDSGENIVVLIPDDQGIFYMADGGVAGDMRLACTNAVQTYVDLWHSGGRGQEAAEALLEHRLKPEWKAKGLKL